MMEKCFVDSVCPPLRIQQAAVEIGHWFADNNIKHWELANCASRDSFEQLRQRVADLEKERDELKLVVSAHADFFSRTQYEMTDLKDQLAKAEQRVAEACALQVATETRFHWLDSARMAKEIRSGEYRKFMKGE